MAKVGGTYTPVVHGVSEREPQHRRPGQTGRQKNMLSDPTYGLIRRRGTRYTARIAAPNSTAAASELAGMGVFDFKIDGKEYALLHRRKASALGKELFAFLYDKSDEQFIPIVYENSTWVDTLVSGGASALAAIGSYVYIAGNDNLPAAVQENIWDTQENNELLAAWFRVGKYSTTYKVRLLRADGTFLEHEYTTKPAAYPEVLDTSDIEFFLPGTTDADPEYQKHVNDRVNEYNGLVTAWISEAAEDITPENIASKLADLFMTDNVSVSAVENGGLLFNDPEFTDIEVEDGGDDTTVYAVGKRINDATRVTKYHFHGKIVRVQPGNAGADESFYLEARLDSGETSGHGAVSWFEVAGVSASITNLVSQLFIHEGTAYVAQDGAGLEGLAAGSGPHPPYDPRVAGDGLTSPLPWFIGKPITMLAVFQDRLMVGSQNYVNASKSGDYLGFFRNSVLNIADDDPVEIFAHGSDGDVLRHGVLYNRNLIIFGEVQQYGIDGNAMLTPRAPLIAPISANKDATDAQPVVSGNYIFYSQHGTEVTASLHQMRVGALNGQATVTDELSDEIGAWLSGVPLQITALTAPNVIMLRTSGHKSQVYLYRYVDDKNNGMRIIGAWHEFEYADALGTIVATASYKKTGLVFTARGGYIVADTLSFEGKPDTYSAADSRVPYEDRALNAVPAEDAVAVVGNAHPSYLLGTPASMYEDFVVQLDGVEPFMEYGVVSPAEVSPTNPFPRDQNGAAVLDGRMSLNRVGVDVSETGGMVGEVTTSNGTVRTTDFEGRILGNSANVLNAQPLFTGQLSISVGREVRECEYTIRSKDWLPLRVTGLSFVGQTFNNVRRVS